MWYCVVVFVFPGGRSQFIEIKGVNGHQRKESMVTEEGVNSVTLANNRERILHVS